MKVGDEMEDAIIDTQLDQESGRSLTVRGRKLLDGNHFGPYSMS